MPDWESVRSVIGTVSLNSLNPFRYQIACRAVRDIAMYSASVVEMATEVCFFDSQLIGQFPNRKTYPEYDFRSERFLPWSASEYPISCSFPSRGKNKEKFRVPFIYLNTRLTAEWWQGWGFAENWERKETECARSGRVPVTRYMREPIICWYRFCSCGVSSSVAFNRWEFGSIGVETGFASCSWNRSKICLAYVDWLSVIPSLLCSTSIPRIQESGPFSDTLKTDFSRFRSFW